MRVFYLILTICAGIILNAPYHNFQEYLAQGDHGRDLYAAQAVLRGEIPYKDFWWVYGPIMPYYYAFFFKIFGVQVPSILLGKLIINVCAGAFFFLALFEFFPTALACIGAIWFMTFHADFFFTYNHAGGITMMLGAIWMHCAYLKSARMKYAWGAFGFVFILGLIKINFAATALLMTILCVVAKDYKNKRYFYVSALFLIPILWLGIYTWFTQGLSWEEVRQCFPYFGGDEPYDNTGPLQTIPMLAAAIFNNLKSNWVHFGMCAIILASLVRTIYLFSNKKIASDTRKTLALTIAYIILFYFLNLHEYLKSGVFYRSFWSQPLSILLVFILIGYATDKMHRLVRIIVCAALGLGIASMAFQNFQRINTFKNPQHFLGSNRGGVYIGNDRNWIQTVVLTTKQLNTILKKNELFLSLPYDCLYYYLTDKKSPTRQLIFFDHIKIPPDQEQKIIAELEQNKISAVLLSSRQKAQEHGLGTLGVTYCPLISQYITTNFTPVSKLGDWEHEPGWAWNHGTLIFKRQ